MSSPTHTEYAIDFGRLTMLREAFERAPEMVLAELEATAIEADVLLQRETQERAPEAFGFLRASIFREETVRDTGVTGLVATPLNYAEPVELGTRPHFPPIQPLVDWVRRKLHITSEKAARGAAFAIATKISRVGTRAQLPFKTTFEHEEEQIRAMFDRTAARISARLAPGGAA